MLFAEFYGWFTDEETDCMHCVLNCIQVRKKIDFLLEKELYLAGSQEIHLTSNPAKNHGVIIKDHFETHLLELQKEQEHSY